MMPAQRSLSYHGYQQTKIRLAQRSRSFPGGEVRLVLIGKTGSGKSSAGNTIMGSEMFQSARGMSSGTDKCCWQQTCRDGLVIEVTDTPGVCDTHRSRQEVESEIAKCVATATPGPHAIIMVLRCDRRFTDEEYQAYQDLKELFGQDLPNHMILVFNGLDELDNDRLQLESELKEKAPPKLRQLLGEAGNMWIGFNNKATWSSRRQQGDRLLDLVSRVVAENGGKYFSNYLVQKFEFAVQVEADNEDKTRDEVKEDIVNDRAKPFLSRLIRVLSFGRVTKPNCTIL